MNSYQLNQWIVHPAQCEILDPEQGIMVQLEPQLMKLLTYLVERQNEVVTRDELAEAIWTSVSIEDNTISRAITRLRKTLKDDYRRPQYIKTLPKRGYRLVAEVRELSPQDEHTNGQTNELATASSPANSSSVNNSSLKIPTSNRLLLAFIFSLLVVAALLVITLLQPSSPLPPSKTLYDTRPLSSQTGRESSPSFSGDGNHFVFVGSHQSESWLYLQQRGQDAAMPLLKLNDPEAKPKWSPTNESIVYSEQVGNRCELILLEAVTSSSMTKKKLLSCQQETRLRPEWHHRENSIFYIEKEKVKQSEAKGDAYDSVDKLIHFNLDTLQRRSVEVPALSGQLVYAKFNPDGKYLGLLSNISGQKMHLVFLELQSNEIFAQLSLNYVIEDFVWHPEEDSIVHVGEHPSHKVIRHFFDDTQINIAASEIGYLDEVRAIGNSQNFAVTSLYLDRDLVLLDNAKESLVIDSAYPDYSGVYSHSYSTNTAIESRSFAFASKRSGRAQIWIKRSDGSIYQLSRFQNAHYIYDIVWSPDNQFLMVRANNDVYVFDISNGRAQKLSLVHTEPKLLGWYDKKNIYYISKQESSSDLILFDIENSTTQLLKQGISQAFYQAENQLWFYSPTQSNAIYKSQKLSNETMSKKSLSNSTANEPFIELSSTTSPVFQSDQQLIAWQVLNSSLFVVERSKHSDLETLINIDQDGNRRRILSRQRIGFFNPITPEKVIITKVTSNESNIIELIAQ